MKLSKLVVLLTLLLLGGSVSFADQSTDGWFPEQKLPEGIIRTTDLSQWLESARTANQGGAPALRIPLQMMVQSVAGLTAKAVNEGDGNELVWVDDGNANLENWYVRLLAAHPDLKQLGVFGPWELVDRYVKRGIIKGYILYRLDQSTSNNKNNTYRLGMDCSVNVATSMAGLLNGIIVDEGLEKTAQAHGLKLLLDVREKTQEWCFQTYRNRFNRQMLCTQDPRKPQIRDLAIAQKAFTVYGNNEATLSAMAWLEPLSPIIGWNGGDEFATTDLSTRYGHIQTATDWCMNLPVLMAGAGNLGPVKGKNLDPASIDWNDQRSGVSFIETDGDNVQWFELNFFKGNQRYWGNPDRGKIPFGWSCCFAHLTQLCPQAVDYALATRSSNDSFIEWGGGYYYPDCFGLNRTNRWDLLAQQARRTWALMKKTDTRIIGFNFSQYDSADAHKAYETFASQTDGLLGILVFQYSPYEGGAGKTFWVKDRNGTDVPVVTARYSIWNHADRSRAGTPAKIARVIRETVAETPQSETPRYDWVLNHAWSYFKQAPGTNEVAEELPRERELKPGQTDEGLGGVRGFSPALWCAERLPENIRVISPDEMLWRIRMKHNPEQTRKLIAEFQP